MRIWRLTPTDPADPIWKIWNPEPILFRAESEAAARRLANLETTKFLPVQPGRSIPINPWSGYKKMEDPTSPTLSEDVTDQIDEYSADGPPAVLRHGERE